MPVGDPAEAHNALTIVNTRSTVASFRHATTLDEHTALFAPDGQNQDALGPVSMSGDVIVTGAPGHDHLADNSGGAYVFGRTQTGEWTLVQELLPDAGRSWEQFGLSVAVDANVLVVGAPGHASQANLPGRAYVFRRSGGSWVLEQVLTASDGATDDMFGTSVAVASPWIVVGAWEDDDQGNQSGSAYVFRYDGSTWTEVAKLVPPDGQAWYHFGHDVACDGQRIIVGASGQPDQSPFRGKAYIYAWDGAAWTLEQELAPPPDGSSGDVFGRSVSILGPWVAVGAAGNDVVGADAGAVFVYHWDGAQWSSPERITPADIRPGDLFGQSVAITPDRLLATSWTAQSHGPSTGAAYVFANDGSGVWAERHKLAPTTSAANQMLGGGSNHAAALFGRWAVVGAYSDDTMGNGRGAVYVFDIRSCAPPCTGDINGDGEVNLTDLAVLLTNYGASNATPEMGDLDGDGDVDLLDLSMLLSNFGVSCPT